MLPHIVYALSQLDWPALGSKGTKEKNDPADWTEGRAKRSRQ